MKLHSAIRSPRRHARTTRTLNVKMRATTARRKRNKMLARFSAVVLSLSLICGVLWFGIDKTLDKFFFENPAYNLRELTLQLDGVMTSEDLIAETGIETGENIFRVDLAGTNKKLREIPMVADVYIERILPDHIKITLTARNPIAWVSPEKDSSVSYDPSEMLLVDNSGMLMRPRLIISEYHRLPVIYGVNIDEIRDGKPLHKDDLKKAITLLDEVAHRPEPLVVIRSLDISKGYCIEAVTDQNARINFAAGDFSDQVARLERLLKHCRDTGRQLETVNLMVAKNTPVKFVVASMPQPVLKTTPAPQKNKIKRN